MLFNIQGYPQKEIEALGICPNPSHILLWNALRELISTQYLDDNKKPHWFISRHPDDDTYFEIDYDFIVTDVPSLRCTARNVRKLISELVSMKLLQRHPQNRGKQTAYFCWGENTNLALYNSGLNKASAVAAKMEKQRQKSDVVSEKQRQKSDVVSEKQRQKSDVVFDALHISTHTHQLHLHSHIPMNEFLRLELVNVGISEYLSRQVQKHFTDEDYFAVCEQFNKIKETTPMRDEVAYLAQMLRNMLPEE